MNKFCFPLLIFIYSSLPCFSQFNVQYQDPKSPEAYLFERYGDIPVTQYNGRQNLSIPLYTVEYGDIKLPLALTYNSNGIRVDEEASNVGLGWYFGTGMITQIVQGKDDLEYNHNLKLPDYYHAPYPQYVLKPYPDFYWQNPQSPYDPHSSIRLNLSPGVPTHDKYFMAKVRSEGTGSSASGILFPYNYPNTSGYTDFTGVEQPYSLYDTERDLFKANFFGHDVLFYKSGSNIIIANNEKYKVSMTQDGNNIFKWKIITPDGITYEFDEQLITYSYSGQSHVRPLLQSDTGYKTFIELGDNVPLDYYGYPNKSRVWKLTKIIDTKNNSIEFIYDTLSKIVSSQSRSGYIDFKNTSASTINFSDIDLEVVAPYNMDGPIEEYVPNPNDAGLYLTTYHSGSVTLLQEKSILKTIVFGEGKVEFGLENRIDIPYDKHIKDISIFYDNIELKKIELSHSYFNASHTDNTQKRLRLDGIEQNDGHYNFEYYTSNLPNKNSLDFDFWGFYNGMSNTSDINDPFRLFEDTNQIPTWGVRDLVSEIEGIANRSAHPEHCKVGILKSIIYPTGGKTEFFYELNTFDNLFFPNYNNKLNYTGSAYSVNYSQDYSQGYGLRLSEMIDYSATSEIATKKRFTYEGGKHIPPYVFMNNDPYRRILYMYGTTGGGGTGSPYSHKKYESGQKLTAYFSNIYQTMLLGNGDGVGYDVVHEELVDNNGENNGKITSEFINIPDKGAREKFGQGGTVPQGHYDKFPYSIRDTNLENGTLTSKKIYNKESQLVQEMEYTYESIIPFSTIANGISSNTTYNVRFANVGTYGNVVVSGSGGSYQTFLATYGEYLFFYYPIRQPKTLLKSENVINYFANASKSSVSEFIYNNNYLVTNKKTKDEAGDVFYEETTQYPYGSSIYGNNFEPQSYIVGGVNHILTKPNVHTIKENGIETKRYQYFYMNDYKLTDKVEEFLKGTTSSDKKRTIDYINYDSYGNILDYQLDDNITNTIIWGYRNNLPIAKLENATYSQVQGYVSNLQNLSDADTDRTHGYNGAEGSLRYALDNLRTAFPNAMVSTYTYDPLVGLTSMTDPKGYTIYYEYDEFNRLKYSKDAEGNILSENNYNYTNQN